MTMPLFHSFVVPFQYHIFGSSSFYSHAYKYLFGLHVEKEQQNCEFSVKITENSIVEMSVILKTVINKMNITIRSCQLESR